MKKFKKLFMLSILAISTFILCGMTTVKAAGFSLSNTDIVCDPANVEKGGRSTCYIIGVPSEDATASVNGYINYIYTTKYLKLVGTQYLVTNSNSTLADATSATAQITPQDDMPDELKSFSCAYDTNISSSIQVSSFGCGIFYTKNSVTQNAFTPSTIKNTGIKSGILQDRYGTIGAILVGLDENATGNECGEVCVKVWRVPEKENYADYTSCGNDGTNANNCGSDTQLQYKCKEIHYKEDGTFAETGAFASYALLVACALIAISAITLAKKNNKFSRI